MALRKSKSEILDRIITKDELSNGYYWSYWDDDDFDLTYCDNCGEYFCRDYDQCIEYKYLPEEFQPKSIEYISKRHRITYHSFSPGRMIDMDSIYSKEALRQKRINHILGIESMTNNYPKITIGDILDSRK